MTHPICVDESSRLYASDWQRAIDSTLRWKDEWGNRVVGNYGDNEVFDSWGSYVDKCRESG